MNRIQLAKVKAVYEGIQAGISNPFEINTVYTYLPNAMESTPMRAKIVAINRFMMLNYHDYLDKLKTEALFNIEDYQKTSGVVESIGTVENLSKHSHVETLNQEEIQTFLTQEEKLDLESNQAGTVFEIKTADGKTKRTRGPNKKK